MAFEIVRYDTTKMHVDAIVNPTNSEMYGVAGVDGMVHKIEGPRLRDETAKISVGTTYQRGGNGGNSKKDIMF
ncbi:MAG: hypothetical protein K8R73_00555 [Clostridiales bacterium]|nr:hypothetical protein [Clostridiales bacterium]